MGEEEKKYTVKVNEQGFLVDGPGLEEDRVADTSTPEAYAAHLEEILNIAFAEGQKAAAVSMSDAPEKLPVMPKLRVVNTKKLNRQGKK